MSDLLPLTDDPLPEIVELSRRPEMSIPSLGHLLLETLNRFRRRFDREPCWPERLRTRRPGIRGRLLGWDPSLGTDANVIIFKHLRIGLVTVPPKITTTGVPRRRGQIGR